MHTLIPTHSEAMCHIPHVRCSGGVGARSGLVSAESGGGGSGTVGMAG